MTRELAVRIGVALVVILLSYLVAKVVDHALARRQLAPGAATRYRILRQSILWAIVFVGVLSALLAIPQVRGVAAGLLASSAVIALILGISAQRTLGNFIAGLLIAFTQPLRLGDEVEFAGTRGVVEEVGLIYTWVRTNESDRLLIPNEKLVSETVRNSTIRSERPVAQVTVRVPLAVDLRGAVAALEPHVDEVIVSHLGEQAVALAVRRYVAAGEGLEQARSDLRLDVAERLRAAGITGAAE